MAKDPDQRPTAKALLGHPFLQGDLSQTPWPYAELLDGHDELDNLMAIVVDKLYEQPLFRASLLDFARVRRIADQLGCSVEEASKSFEKMFERKHNISLAEATQRSQPDLMARK